MYNSYKEAKKEANEWDIFYIESACKYVMKFYQKINWEIKHYHTNKKQWSVCWNKVTFSSKKI